MNQHGESLRWSLIDEHEHCRHFHNTAEVEEFLRAGEATSSGTETLWEDRTTDAGPPSWRKSLMRVLNRNYYHRLHLTIQWHGDFATVCFSDEKFGELTAENPAVLSVPSDVLADLSSGEPTPLPLEHCFIREEAFDLVYKYLPKQTLPKSVTYKHVP